MKVTAANEQLAAIIQKKLGKEPVPAASNDAPVKQASNATHSSSFKAINTHVAPSYKEKDTILKRAERRKKLSLIRKQQNIENILQLAVDYCPSVTSDGEPDADWIERFMTLAEDSSNRAMQRLWAKILAGETIKPGSFSYKSLLTLKEMTQTEANALQLASSLSGRCHLDGFNQLLTGYYVKPSLFSFLSLTPRGVVNLSKSGLAYPQILTLIDIDALYAQEIESSELSQGEVYHLTFGKTELALKAKKSGLVLTYYKFTQTGHALSRLTQNHITEQFKQQIQESFGRSFEVSFTTSE